MVRVKFYRLPAPAMLATFLTGIVVALVYRFSPIKIFFLVASYPVLVGFINVILPSCFLCSRCLFWGVWVRYFSASKRAYFSFRAALDILRHFRATYGTLCFYTCAHSAHLICLVRLVLPASTYKTFLPDGVCIRFEFSGAGHAKVIFSCFPVARYHRDFCAAILALRNAFILAIKTYSIIATVFLAEFTQVLSHVSILPQLPDMVLDYEM